MSLPTEVIQIIEELTSTLVTSQQSLTTAQRLRLYQSFGLSRVTRVLTSSKSVKNNSTSVRNDLSNWLLADYALAWLAILSGKHVLPIWERIKQQPSQYEGVTPEYILDQAQSVLQEKVKMRDAINKKTQDFNFPIEVFTSFDVALVYRTAYQVLELITVEDKYLIFFLQDDDSVRGTGSDFARSAMRAYSYKEKVINKIPGIETDVNEEDFDIQRGLEFWQWWLTEAVPYAWKLAEESIASLRQSKISKDKRTV